MKMFVRLGGQRGWGSCKMGDAAREGGGTTAWLET